MSGARTEKQPPAILVLTQVIRDYRAVNDPAGLGALLFPLEQCLSGEEYTPPKTGAELNIFNRLLDAAKRGIESYEKMSKRGQAGAAASNAKRTQAAQPSAPVAVDRGTGGKPDTSNRHPSNAPQGAPVRREIAPQGAGTSNKPATVPAKPSAPVAPVRRIIESARDKRTGGARALADCIGDIVARFGRDGAGVSIEEKIAGEPVAAALEITGETGNARAVNTFKKLLRTKGAGAFSDQLFAFYSELKQGETPDNYGAALVSRLSKLPDVPARERGAEKGAAE